AISSFVALTLGPMIAARLPEDRPPGRVGRALRATGARGAALYQRLLVLALDRAGWLLALCLLIAVAAAWGATQLRGELTPAEDRGLLVVRLDGPDGVGLAYVDRQLDQALEHLQPLREQGLIQNVFTITGRYDPNGAEIVAPLVDWDQRTRSQQEIARAGA